ncbi:orotate phosphoribosyltransferase-like protein [uncultured Methanobrevibacter sp.]|uniref:orotate phosphoribosyltransferase-like protein n=1 Tax=uncultured Methanobrevibacter sp. TaxID=253161 RepID=UPI0025FF258D|nr:orotate phosphoribosyltransferase-like protein [uncultured Methanobrevibacter sp.]
MNQDLINRAQELRNHGFTTGEIADELNVSMDTAQWLTLQKPETSDESDAPVDIAINWNSLGGSATRLRYVSAALSEIALKHGDLDLVLGIATSGVPFATMMADVIEELTGTTTCISIFHPKKHRTNPTNSDEGAISSNFGTVEGKRIVVVDDVITSGDTIKDVIKVVKDHGGDPVVVTVLIDKSGLEEVDGVPVESLIKVNQLS